MKKIYWILIACFVALVAVISIGFGLNGKDFLTQAWQYNTHYIVGNDPGGSGGSNCANDEAYRSSDMASYTKIGEIVMPKSNGGMWIVYDLPVNPNIKIADVRFVSKGPNSYYFDYVKAEFADNNQYHKVERDRDSKRCKNTYFGISELQDNHFIDNIELKLKNISTRRNAKVEVWVLPNN